MKLTARPGQALLASVAIAALVAAATALARDAGVESATAVPPSLYGLYDALRVESG